MPEADARIRVYEPADDKLVRFAIGKANMEALAAANRRTYVHPLTITLWIALSSAFIQIAGLWPKPELGYAGYLSPLPGFAATAVPIMFLIDWLNRPSFEKMTVDVLSQPDIINIQRYARSPFSGFYILEYGDKFVGLLALDTSPDATTDPKSNSKTKSKSNTDNKGSATIRHFYVDEPYRPSDIQDDLLGRALRHAFAEGSPITRVYAQDSPLVPYVGRCLHKAGFVSQEVGEKMGMLGWRKRTRRLDRTEWAARMAREWGE